MIGGFYGQALFLEQLIQNQWKCVLIFDDDDIIQGFSFVSLADWQASGDDDASFPWPIGRHPVTMMADFGCVF
jgi:hypothetical protein